MSIAVVGAQGPTDRDVVLCRKKPEFGVPVAAHVLSRENFGAGLGDRDPRSGVNVAVRSVFEDLAALRSQQG